MKELVWISANGLLIIKDLGLLIAIALLVKLLFMVLGSL